MKNETPQTEEKTLARTLEEFHFAGSGEYEPITIKAATIEEATAEWERKRTPIGGEKLVDTN